MPRIKVKTSSKDKLITVQETLKRMYSYLGITTEQLANSAVDVMEDKINSNRTRHRLDARANNLTKSIRNTITIKPTRNQYLIGIGTIKKLDKLAPYWHVINYGGSPWKGKSFFGIFQDGKPIKGKKGNAWLAGGTNDTGQMYMMRPKKPIRGKFYIQAAEKYLRVGIGKLRKDLSDMLKSGKPLAPTSTIQIKREVAKGKSFIDLQYAAQVKQRKRTRKYFPGFKQIKRPSLYRPKGI